MTQLDITQAKADMSKLLDLAIKGEEIVITKDNKPVVKISPITPILPPPKRGSAKGKVWMSDEPLEDFKEYEGSINTK